MKKKRHRALSPEIDLLETLTGQDESLLVALRVFGATDDAQVFERARRAVEMQAKMGLIQIVRKAGGTETLLQNWELRPVLEDKANWLKHPDRLDAPTYWLRLTAKGYEAFVEGSASFFEELFSR